MAGFRKLVLSSLLVLLLSAFQRKVECASLPEIEAARQQQQQQQHQQLVEQKHRLLLGIISFLAQYKERPAGDSPLSPFEDASSTGPQRLRLAQGTRASDVDAASLQQQQQNNDVIDIKDLAKRFYSDWKRR